MSLKKCIQGRICDALWVVITRIERDVIEEFTDKVTKQAEMSMHKCTCQEGTCQDRTEKQDHECGCMTVERLRKVEQEWIERGIIR